MWGARCPDVPSMVTTAAPARFTWRRCSVSRSRYAGGPAHRDRSVEARSARSRAVSPRPGRARRYRALARRVATHSHGGVDMHRTEKTPLGIRMDLAENPMPVHRELHDRGPLIPNDGVVPTSSQWVATSWDTVSFVLRNAELFSSADTNNGSRLGARDRSFRSKSILLSNAGTARSLIRSSRPTCCAHWSRSCEGRSTSTSTRSSTRARWTSSRSSSFRTRPQCSSRCTDYRWTTGQHFCGGRTR